MFLYSDGCETKTTCKLDKYRYSTKHAEASYRDKLETSRSGINITKSDLQALDRLISPHIKEPLSILLKVAHNINLIIRLVFCDLKSRIVVVFVDHFPPMYTRNRK
jgi:hypothetical protein